jgi:SAM-dependent methyltransferase
MTNDIVHKSTVDCPDCGHEAKKLGDIVPSNLFAGVMQDVPIDGGSLFRCFKCHLGFRFPRLSKEKLDLLYLDGVDTNWSSESVDRKDWSIVEKQIRQLLQPGASVLDIGCFDGGFLEKIVDNYPTFGIEIHEKALGKAASKGISIIGKDFSKITGKYDFITSFDVIEHAHNPFQFLSNCLDATHTGGFVAISSGNMDALSFRMMRGRYWYCSISEHISFISPKWCEKLEPKLGFKIEKVIKFRHDQKSSLLKQYILNYLYWLSPATIRVIRKLGFSSIDIIKYPTMSEFPPYWGRAKDHVMILLRKL